MISHHFHDKNNANNEDSRDDTMKTRSVWWCARNANGAFGHSLALKFRNFAVRLPESMFKSIENALYAFFFKSNSFISNIKLKFAHFERRISENTANQTLLAMQHDDAYSK